MHHVWYVRRPEDYVRFPGTGIVDSCELPWGCRNSNPGPLEEQLALISAEPSLKVLYHHLNHRKNYRKSSTGPSALSSLVRVTQVCGKPQPLDFSVSSLEPRGQGLGHSIAFTELVHNIFLEMLSGSVLRPWWNGFLTTHPLLRKSSSNVSVLSLFMLGIIFNIIEHKGPDIYSFFLRNVFILAVRSLIILRLHLRKPWIKYGTGFVLFFYCIYLCLHHFLETSFFLLLNTYCFWKSVDHRHVDSWSNLSSMPQLSLSTHSSTALSWIPLLCV